MKKSPEPTPPKSKAIPVTCNNKDCTALATIVHTPLCKYLKEGERLWCNACEPEVKRAGCWRRERLMIPGQISSSVAAPDRDDDWDNV